MAESCGVCEAEFGSPADLIAHMKERHGVEPERIPQAPVAAAPVAAQGTRRPDPFVCPICQLAFSTRERLAWHNLTADHSSIVTGHPACATGHSTA